MTTRLATGLLMALSTIGWAYPFAYVPGALSDDLTVIDTETNAVVTAIPVGDFPIAVAVHPANTRIYTANRDAGTISEIDPSTNLVVATIPTGNHVNSIVVHPDGLRMYAAHFDAQDYGECTSSCTGYVSEIDLVSHATTATVPVGLNLSQLAIHPDGVRLYASDNTSNVLWVIDTNTNTIVHGVPTGGSQPQSIVFNRVGSVAYVANTAGNSVGVIDALSDAFVTAIPVGNNPTSLALTPDDARLYVPNTGLSGGGGGTISVIDTATNMVLTTVPGGANNSGIAMTADGRAYVTNVATDSVSVLNTSSNMITTTIPVGLSPYAYGRFIAGGPPACTNDSQCAPLAGPCHTAACTIATGTCAVESLPDETACEADGSGGCSIADSCRAGVCEAGGGGDPDGDGLCEADDNCPGTPNTDQADLDNDGTGNLCDPSDAPLTVTKVRFKRARSTTASGSIMMRGTFVATSVADAVTATAGMTLRFQDSLAAVPQQTWPPAECLTASTGRITCRSLDRTAQLKLVPLRSPSSGFRVEANLRRRALQPPFAGPIVVTLTYGAGIDRAGALAACASTNSGIMCLP